jgi:hypothetical protein
VAAAVEVRLQGGIEVDRAGGFAGLGCLPRHDTCSRLGDARALFRVVMRASPLQG